jgi:hypothetical protein
MDTGGINIIILSPIKNKHCHKEEKIFFKGKQLMLFPSCNIVFPLYAVREGRASTTWPKGKNKFSPRGFCICFFFLFILSFSVAVFFYQIFSGWGVFHNL